MGNFNGEGRFTQETRLERESEVSIWVVTEATGVTVQSKSLRDYRKEQVSSQRRQEWPEGSGHRTEHEPTEQAS